MNRTMGIAMRQPTYIGELSEEERGQLEMFIRKGRSSARKQTRARILLNQARMVCRGYGLLHLLGFLDGEETGDRNLVPVLPAQQTVQGKRRPHRPAPSSSPRPRAGRFPYQD